MDAAAEPSTSAVMPDVVGLKLDVAKSDIKSSGFEDEVEVLDDGTFGVQVESNWTVCEQVPAAGETVTVAPSLTVRKSCDDVSKTDEAATSTTAPEPKETTTTAPAYAYTGPKYEVITVDKKAGMGALDQHWIYTDELDYSTDAYKDQLKLLIADVARTAGTNKLIVEVVTDREIAGAKAISTYQAFEAEHGADYVTRVIREKGKTGWVASYTGGYDSGTGKLSDSDTAFEVVWFIGSDDPTFEMWKP